MSMPDNPFPVNIQENEISGNLNSSMFLNFLIGIYSMVYGGTMYIYISKKPANLNRHIVLSAISFLYLLCFLDLIVEWYYLDWVIVINGETRESIFLGTEDGLQWIWVLSAILENSLLIISDGLLIWRCYHVWGQSFQAISAPFILLVAECGLFFASMVLRMKFGQTTSDANIILFDNIFSALIFVSLGTTVITTFLIGYRLHSVSQLKGSQYKGLFNHIVIMITESAAAYALVLFLYAIDIVVPSFNVLGSPMYEAGYYIEAIVTVVAGMAPTILVARIALTDPSRADASGTLTHILGDLKFGSQQQNCSGCSGNATGTDINASAHTDNVEPTPVIEVKRVSNVDALFVDNQV